MPLADYIVVLLLLLTASGLALVDGLLFTALGLFLACWGIAWISIFSAILGGLGLFWGLKRLYPGAAQARS